MVQESTLHHNVVVVSIGLTVTHKSARSTFPLLPHLLCRDTFRWSLNFGGGESLLIRPQAGRRREMRKWLHDGEGHEELVLSHVSVRLSVPPIWLNRSLLGICAHQCRVSDIVSKSFRYSLGDKDDLLLVATFRIPYDHFDTINVGWRQLENFTNTHPSSGLKLQNEPISYIQGGVDDFIHGLPVDHCPGSYSWWSKDSPNDGTVAGVGQMELIAIVDVVEKCAKVSTPGVFGALFSGIGHFSEEGEDLL